MVRLILIFVFSGLLSTIFAQNMGIGTALPASTLDINGSLGLKVTVITGSTTLTSNDAVILCNNSNPFTVTLPSAAGITGRIYTIKNINNGTVTIVGSANQTIDGFSSRKLSSQYQLIQLVSNGNNWNILNDVSPESIAFTFTTDFTVGNSDFIGNGSSSSSFTRNTIVSPMECELNSIALSIRSLSYNQWITATVWVNNLATTLSTTIVDGSIIPWSSSSGSVFINPGDLISVRLTWNAGGALANGVTATVTYH